MGREKNTDRKEETPKQREIDVNSSTETYNTRICFQKEHKLG
jgi:hypothetical protein